MARFKTPHRGPDPRRLCRLFDSTLELDCPHREAIGAGLLKPVLTTGTIPGTLLHQDGPTIHLSDTTRLLEADPLHQLLGIDLILQPREKPVTLQGPASPEEPHISFAELMSRLVKSREIEASQQPGPSTDRFYDVVQGEQSISIALPLITTLQQAMTQPWDLLAQPQPTSRRYEAMYRIQEGDIPFLLRHPKPNLVVVESSQGRDARGHTAPRDKEGRKMDSALIMRNLLLSLRR
ncbi:uncharacterized protein LOC123024533 isoform X2 [Varanus komodoensis]|uniref:uncharacterized protein LOC123024533 isoform X2 n=1 Tax=Varanus komodoensis TaxID=61221 RepID=UPI001CF79C28|nr:uncharacterized protein LOC123024533 isoform X2 [Varanus komodoensis]